MKKLLLLFFSIAAFSQNTVSESVWDEDFYKKYDEKTFINFNSFYNTINIKKIDYPLLHAAIFYLTNNERIKRNLEPFKWSLNLEIAAYNHSKDMVIRNYFSHLSKKLQKRGRLAGITNSNLTENIANTFSLNYDTQKTYYTHSKNSSINGEFRFSYDNNESNLIPFHSYLSLGESLVKQWMNSTGHRKNILSNNGLELGVGAYLKIDDNFPMFYVTQNFQWFEYIMPTNPISPLPPGW